VVRYTSEILARKFSNPCSPLPPLSLPPTARGPAYRDGFTNGAGSVPVSAPCSEFWVLANPSVGSHFSTHVLPRPPARPLTRPLTHAHTHASRISTAGIPKFYRWLSERYPLINQPGGATVIPVIDNFYLDMNGIVHNCTHGNDPDVKLTEEEMIKKIFVYLDKLFHIVKPQKLMFMAIDGVAPRAKMNQQRARRFKTAREAADHAAKKALEEPGNSEGASQVPPFDSNCITPGTPFMERLAEHLKFFVRHKVAEDPLWQVPTIVLSGHDVPGEGEHKIMEYIRWSKKAPNYEPNLRHCLYGLDADLIMLSLVTHEPHFCLLREVVDYKNKGQPLREALENPSQEHFVLLQIGLLRDYVQLEFDQCASTLPFKFDIERVIDDFVLFCMLVGNDFLPPLPTCDINEGSLNLMFSTYKRLLPKMGGYLTHAGSLHRGRVEIFLADLALHEAETLEQRAQEAEQFEAKRDRRNGPGKMDAAFADLNVEDLSKPMDFTALQTLQQEGHELELLAAVEGSESEAEGAGTEEKAVQQEPTMMSKEARQFFEMGDRDQGLVAWKERYYREKLKSPKPADRRRVVSSYIEGLHWVLEYYYRGVASWDWYYPYHYAPMVSDLVDLSAVTVAFTPGRPFLPYEQLMAVQPSSSCKLLPEPYRHLMTDVNSPIKDFYPVDFLVDVEGKRAEWEGVVLIPFIDEDRLLRAMSSVPQGSLSAGERRRNAPGNILVFVHDPKSQEKSFCKSTIPGHFNDVVRCNSSAKVRPAPPPLPAGERGFEPILVKGTSTGVSTIPGFPTLKTLAVHGRLEKANVNVFGMDSKKESLILKVKDMTQGVDPRMLTAQAISKAVLKQRAWVAWPYVKESIVDKVSDATTSVSSNGSEGRTADWDIVVSNMKKEFLSKRGVDLGNVKLMVHVRPLEGLIRQVDGSVEKRFGKETVAFPLQMTLRKNPAPDPRYDPKLLGGDDSVVWHDFKEGTKAIFLGKAYYGCPAKISHSGPLGRDHDGKLLAGANGNAKKSSTASRYRIVIETASDASASVQAAAKRILPSMAPNYVLAGKVARMLGVSPKALGRITGNCFVRHGSGRNDSIDIGLRVKDAKDDLLVPDYCGSIPSADPTRRPSWGYTNELINVMKTYKQKYPNVWACLDEDRMSVEEVFPGLDKEAAVNALKGCKKWLASLPSAKRKLVKGSSITASADAIRYFQASIPPPQTAQLTVEMENVSPAMLLPPIEPGGMMAAFSGGSFVLGDRVVAAGSTGVPFGLRGTIVGVHEQFVEVLFDQEFDGGNDLQGRCLGAHGAVCMPSMLINLSRTHAVTGGGERLMPAAAPAKPAPWANRGVQPRIPEGKSKGFGMGRGSAPPMGGPPPGAPRGPPMPVPVLMGGMRPPHGPPIPVMLPGMVPPSQRPAVTQHQQPPQQQQQRQWMPPAGKPGAPPQQPHAPPPPPNAGMALLGQLKGANPQASAPSPQKQPMTVQQVQQAQQQEASNKGAADALWQMLKGRK